MEIFALSELEIKSMILIVDSHSLCRAALQALATLLFPDDEIVAVGTAEEGMEQTLER